jgi:hypothetical protein
MTDFNYRCRPCGPQFYLSYAGSGTGADSQYALIKSASDGSDTYLVPVLEKTQASLFALADNGQLVSGASIANLSQDVDVLSFDPTSTIQQNGFTTPSFITEGDKLIAQGSTIAFNVCPPSSYVSHRSVFPQAYARRLIVLNRHPGWLLSRITFCTSPRLVLSGKAVFL